LATPSTLIWATGGFVPTAAPLVLNSPTALSEVTVLNPINLNGAAHTIQVDDNTSTTTDIAILPSVISGTGTSGITKTGAGWLYLLGDNTYAGNTTLQNGLTFVKSIGSTSSTSSNLGAGTGSLLIGSSTTTVYLHYVG